MAKLSGLCKSLIINDLQLTEVPEMNFGNIHKYLAISYLYYLATICVRFVFDLSKKVLTMVNNLS
jgi:hypothetical protein